MKAVRLHREGGPEQLVYEDAPEPELGAGDALIRVHATGITPAELTWAETYRNCDGSERLPAIPGHEVSGVVESVADGVSDVSIGSTPFFPSRATSTGSTPAVLATVSNLIPGGSGYQTSRPSAPRGITMPYHPADRPDPHDRAEQKGRGQPE